jgi:hypothetical protein
MVVNVILVLNLVRLVIQGRKIPSKFNDGRLMGIIVYTLAFILISCLATSIFMTDTQALYTLESSSFLLAAFCCTVIYTAPKIYGGLMNQSSVVGQSEVIVKTVDTDFICIHCGKGQKVTKNV